MLKIREEKQEDINQIRALNQKAFGQLQESELVDKLRNNVRPFISLVAELDHKVVGHILFTPVFIETNGQNIEGMGLAPMAVLPEFQKQGIGSALVKEGLELLKRLSCPFVVVLGHPEYYPRFGFEPAIQFGIRCEWEVPDGAFMILAFESSTLKQFSGIVKYRPEFSQSM